MTDPRTRVPLNGEVVRLDQLASEVGAALAASDTEVVVCDPAAKLTATSLAGAAVAHVSKPVEAASDLAAVVAELAAVKAEVRAVTGKQ